MAIKQMRVNRGNIHPNYALWVSPIVPDMPTPNMDERKQIREQVEALVEAAPTLHQELANALVLIRLKYGNLDPEVWAWQQKVSELLKSLKVE